MRKLAIAVISLALPAWAAVAGSTPPSGRQHFSIAGIGIGDKSINVFSSLRREGYKVIRITRSASFTQRLTDARNAELRLPPNKTKVTDIGSVYAVVADQRLWVTFDDDASGSRVVSAVNYEASYVAHPFPQVRRKLTERYGEPQATDGTGSAWCSLDPAEICLAGGRRGERIKIGFGYRGFDPTAETAELTTIRLDAGEYLIQRWRAAFRAALSKAVKTRDAF